MKQNEIERLAAVLESCVPGCKVRLDAPANPQGAWFLDAKVARQVVTVEWRPRKGFGVTANSDAGLGEGPEEVYPDLASVTRRALELLMFQEQTTPPPIRLGDLRRARGISQQKLAQKLKKGQASVSKIESRGRDIRLRTLDRVVRALGGKLSIRARFPGGLERELHLEEP